MLFSLSRVGRGAVLAVAFVALSSCATMTKDECQTADWYKRGEQDGAGGKAPSYIAEHRRSCADYKLPVDEGQWHAGWEQGIRLYCTPENGLQQGRHGNYYANSCPADLKYGFESAYSVAKEVHDARSARDSIQSELDSLYRDLRKAEKPEDRRRLEDKMESRRFALRNAERRVWDAERDYDGFVSSRGMMSRRW